MVFIFKKGFHNMPRKRVNLWILGLLREWWRRRWKRRRQGRRWERPPGVGAVAPLETLTALRHRNWSPITSERFSCSFLGAFRDFEIFRKNKIRKIVKIVVWGFLQASYCLHRFRWVEVYRLVFFRARKMLFRSPPEVIGVIGFGYHHIDNPNELTRFGDHCFHKSHEFIGFTVVISK